MSIASAFADSDTEVTENEVIKDTTPEFVIPYKYRRDFRNVLMGYKDLGDTYIVAEHKAKLWFNETENIPYDAWNYRETKTAIKMRQNALKEMGII